MFLYHTCNIHIRILVNKLKTLFALILVNAYDSNNNNNNNNANIVLNIIIMCNNNTGLLVLADSC